MNINQQNLFVMSQMSEFLNNAPDCIQADVVNELAQACTLTHQEAYAYVLATYMGLDLEKNDRDIFREYFLNIFEEVDEKMLSENPYIKDIVFPNIKQDSVELKYCSYKPCEAFVLDDTCIMPNGKILPKIGFFMSEQSYPAILENDRIWMTVTPMEIKTMQPAIEKAHGKVLTYGLGLGYFTYMVSLKNDVESITVVEKNENIIRTFNQFILPQFKSLSDKVKIVHMDAFEYAKNHAFDEQYNFVFTDLWHDVSDGEELYFLMKKYEHLLPNATHMYWIEKSILSYRDLMDLNFKG